jgi:KaiC/GvpD/RAD55 family RecA-like ATPase
MIMVSTGVEELDHLLKDGYPDKSTILVVGPPGVGKEALGYWFSYSGLLQGDFCTYVTTLPVTDVMQDFRAYHVDLQQRVPLWVASAGGQLKCDVNDLASLSINIKEILRKNPDKRVRIVTDVLSSILM